jgi:hypothetical protein
MSIELVNVRFPSLNKNDSLRDNNKALKEGYSSAKARVMKTLTVDSTDYNLITNSLLSDNPIWDNIGGQDVEGTDIDPDIYKEICKQDAEGKFWFSNEKLSNEFRKFCYAEVVKLESKDKLTLYINTEGYNYARYVGISSVDYIDMFK